MLKEKLKAARKAAGLTQKAAAEAIGVTESTYCGYETGKRTPDPRKISALAKVFGVSGDYLLDIEVEDIKKEPALSNENGSYEKVKAMLMSLTPDEVEKVGAFVQGLIASR